MVLWFRLLLICYWVAVDYKIEVIYPSKKKEKKRVV